MRYAEIIADNNRLFEQGAFDGMRSQYVADVKCIKRERSKKFVLSENLVKMTTVQCIIENAGKSMIALNFASAKHPGGGYIKGASAQEESICRASGLYYTLKDVHEFYDANYKHRTPDYTDGMIYSEDVPVIRYDSGEKLEVPIKCAFITSPAVNRTRAKEIMSDEKINAVMKRRIEKIVSFAAEKQPQLLILGAYGCGVFGNNREVVLPMFENAINEYAGDMEVVFAIP